MLVPPLIFSGAGPAAPAVGGVVDLVETAVIPMPDNVGVAARVQRYLGLVVVGAPGICSAGRSIPIRCSRSTRSG